MERLHVKKAQVSRNAAGVSEERTSARSILRYLLTGKESTLGPAERGRGGVEKRRRLSPLNGAQMMAET